MAGNIYIYICSKYSHVVVVPCCLIESVGTIGSAQVLVFVRNVYDIISNVMPCAIYK